MTGTRGTGPRDVPADAELEALLEGITKIGRASCRERV